MPSTKTARPIILIAIAALLLLCLCGVLFQFTEIDAPVTNAFRGVVPSGLKDVLRPLRAPQVLDFAPAFNAKDIAPTSPITITFLTPMSSSDNAIQISPNIRGAWKWSNTTAIFTPAESWPLSTTVSVTVTRDARSWLMRRADKDFAWSFNVVAPTSIVSTEPRQGAQFAYLQDRLTILFNREMDRKSVEERLKVDPPIANMSLLWEANQLIIGGNLKPSTAYKFFLPSGAKDTKYGLTIANDFAWSFTTTQQYPYLSIINIGRYGLTTADKPTTLKLQSVNVSRVDVALYKFDTATYIQTLAFSYDKWRTFKPDGDPIKTWTLNPSSKIDQYVTQDLQLDALPAGTYYLTAKSAEGVNDTQVLVATKTALTLKRTTDQVLVWATSITDGSPVEKLLLTFYNSKGESVGTGATDKDGIFGGTIQSTKDSLYVVGVREGDVAAVSDQWEQGIEPWRFENVQYQWNPMKHTYRVYVYTDRPLYRPGQTVFFKAIVRSDDDGSYSQPPAGTQVQIKVGDWQDRTLYNKTLTTSAFGSIADSFTVNPEAGLGSYQIVAKIGDEEYSNDIQVEEYRKPEYSVSVSTDRSDYINGDTITATVSASYFFGGAVTGSPVHWTLYSNDYYFYWSGGDFDFGNVAAQRYFGYGREVSSGDATLNANGELVLKLPANITNEERSQVYTLEASVTDESNQPQSGIAAVLVHRGSFYVGMKPTNYVGVKGTPARFDAQTVDTSGKPVGKIAVSYTLNLINWNCYQKKDDKGRYIWTCDEIKTEIQRGDWTTDATGKYQLAFTPPKGGAYRLDAQGKDTRGNRVLGQTWLWVSDSSEFLAWQFENDDRIGLVLDKKEYKIGDVAKVLIQSPYQKATALVTLERGKIISRQLVAMDSNSATVNIPITDAYYPNVYVGVVLIPQGGFADGIPSFKMGLANIPIVSDAKTLNVNVSSTKPQYLPRDKATYNIKTLDANSKPVSAEVSLSIVDKAVLALASNFGADITQGFYGKRDLAVNTAQSLTVFLARVNQREDFGGGGGGGGEEPRKSFPDIAYWNPTIVTDASGSAKVDVTLPDNLTTWTAIANGVTAATQVGKAQSDTLVTKDLIVRPVLPRFLNVGDKVTLGTIVRNSTTQSQTVQISLEATNLYVPISSSGPALTNSVRNAITATNPISPHQVSMQTIIAPGQSTTVNWLVTVPNSDYFSTLYSPDAAIPFSTTITMSARGNGVSDAVQISLPIEPFGEKQVVANAGQADNPENNFTMTVPKDASFATLKLSASPSLAAGLIDSLQYLTGYPYGCVEQTMSRFMPDVLVKQTLDKLQIKNDKLQAELPKQVADSLTRLYNFQHGDGGWGWWENDDSMPYETAYVLYGLMQAKKAGYQVDDNVIKNATQYLKTPLVDSNDYNLKVYIEYALAEAGQGDAALARSMIDMQDKMTLNSRAMLALLLKSFGENASAKTIISDLEKKVIESGQLAHWEETQTDTAHWEYFTSNGRSTAMILRAILAVDPQSPLVQKTVRYLMINRTGGYWRTTQETAQTIIALTDYLAQSGELTANFAYNVFVDGKDFGKQSISPSNLSQQQTITLRLDPGTHQVQITKSGDGRLYFATTLQYYSSVDAVGAKTSLDGPVIRREYLDPKSDKTLTSFKVGDLVRVKLTIDMPREGWYMMVTDPLPAGFEAVNFSLNTSGIEPTSKSGFRSYWSRPDLRDDRAVFFTTYMWKGKHTYTYLIRATSSGTFRALPAEVVPMYEPDVFGRSASVEMAVKP